MSADEGDLIDLGTGASVSPGVASSGTPPDPAEEQEHLLDVCPPKLEQKLSLGRRRQQQQQQHELARESESAGDVLVTLGHDKVVPIGKRIDVVSSDTIKRIRDIAKNLEPVVRGRSPCEDANVETLREIDDAFDFLSELQRRDRDDESYEERLFARMEEGCAPNEFVSSDGPLMEEEDDDDDDDDDDKNNGDESSSSRPSESTCLAIKRGSSGGPEVDYRNGSIEAVRRPDGKLEDSDCSSPFERGKRRRGAECSSSLRLPKSFRGASEVEEPPGSRASSRRSRRRPDRKSWSSEGVAAPARATRLVSASGVDEQEPSTSDGVVTSVRRSLTRPSADGFSDHSSECSEVDWSWVEEVERFRAAKESRTEADDDEDDDDEEDDEEQVAMREEKAAASSLPTIEATSASPSRTRDTPVGARGSKRSVAMSVVATAKSPLSAGSPGPPEFPSVTRGHDAPSNSWVRASMRRLRHLRLPEATAEREVLGTGATRDPPAQPPNSLPDIALIAPEILAAQTNGTASPLRPSSAPAPAASAPRRGRRCASGNRWRNRESRRSSVSRTSGSDFSCSGSPPTTTTTTGGPASTATSRTCERQRGAERDNDRGENGDGDEDENDGDDDDDDDNNEEDDNPLGRWPHTFSPTLACLGCTLGLFNISRFAVLSVEFGANFIIQFLVLSLILGVPLLTLQVCLGQRLAAGAVDMWKISPLFQGVGIALLTAQAFIGVYSIVGVSWMFVYFRDSFITEQDRYRWAEPFLLYREDSKPSQNGTAYKLDETVPDYFSGAVLQRHHLAEPLDPGVVTLKFQLAFNLAVVWMIVFVSLSKGLRSYGKVVYVFTPVPVFGTLVLCAKLLGLTPTGTVHQLFPATIWSEFFINGKSWVAASSEVFLTWGLLGAAAMQVAAHNKHKHLLQRDTSLVVVLTVAVLLLAAFLANTCVQIIRHHGYVYTTSSFERISGYSFMRPVDQPAPPGYVGTPGRFMSHASFLVGQRVVKPGADLGVESGYQVLRFATELVPATLALLGAEQVSPFWAVLFYFVLILFGIAQQLAIWHCVITGIMAINTKATKLWETTITFFSCACAYVLGLPMATELGIYVVYFLDYTLGGAWWIMVLYLVQVGAVFAVRGRPHTGEAVVAELFPPTGGCLRHWAGPLLSFTWNVVLPVTLMVLSITVFKSSGFRELYTYRRTSRDYWAVWSRQLGAAIQLTPILMIPAVAIVQTCRYLNNGPPDIFDRIQLLYRPSMEPEEPRDAPTQIGGEAAASLHGSGIQPAATDAPFEDPPPKYTPPPSYTTATGARIAKMLRHSFRRSMRRIANALGEGSAPTPRPALQPPPPDYAAVLVEMNQSLPPRRDVSIDVADATIPRSGTRDGERRRPSTVERMTRISTVDRSGLTERAHSTMDRARRARVNAGSSNLTAADVANLLRSSIRRGTARTRQTLCHGLVQDGRTAAAAAVTTTTTTTTTTASAENLVEAAAPIGRDAMEFSKGASLVTARNYANDNKKTADRVGDSVSVI